MTFHIVLDKHTDLDAISQEAARGDRPRHAMAMLRDQLDAVVHAPDPAATARLDDRVRSRLIGSPGTWALARQLAAQTGRGDVIFCGGEHSGFPVAAVAGGRKNGPRVAMMVHNVDRTRARVALRAFGLKRRADLIFSPSRPQIDFLGSVGLAAVRRSFIYDQTDIGFFHPGPQQPKSRPLVVSVGLEQRDYRTLASATEGMDLDVRISGFSTDAALLAETFPETIPVNFHQSFYEWRDLGQLYRDADVVVVAVRPNRYAAGVQALVEGMASGRPVVVTASVGLTGYLEDAEAVTTVPQRDPAAMRAAIEAVLADPAAAASRGQRARAIAESRYDSTVHVDTIAQALRGLARG